MAAVESRNGAPRMAPIPTSSAAAVPTKMIAMIGIIVSGSAVPTAARTLPTIPSPKPSFLPNHSIPFVKSSAPARMTMNETSSSAASTMRFTRPPCLLVRELVAGRPAPRPHGADDRHDEDDREEQHDRGEGQTADCRRDE